MVSGNDDGQAAGGVESRSFGGSTASDSFGGSSAGSGAFGGSSGSGNFGGSSAGSGAFGGSSGGNGGGADGGVTKGDSQVIDISGGGGSSANIVYKPVVKQGPPQITKHFYIHEAPEEGPNVEVREKEISVRPQKHYKILFIKAPSAESSASGGSALVFPPVN